MALRVTLDTTVTVSAIGKQGPGASQILAMWLQGEMKVVLSEPILNETRNSLAGVGLRADFIEQWIERLRTGSEIVIPKRSIDVCRKQGDNRILEAAVEGKADLVVSNDKHLWSLKSFEGIKILKVDKFLKRMGL